MIRHALALAVVLVASTLPAHADVSYVPVPEIITDPNEGNTFGLLGVALITDENDRVEYMVAPDVRYNKTKGIFPTFRLFGYPTDKRDYSITLGKSTTKDEDYEAEYNDTSLLDGRAFLHAFVVYERDSTERFYGYGNHSDAGNEGNYTAQNFHAKFNPGYMVLPHLSLNYMMRIRRFAMQRGQVDSRNVIDLVRCVSSPHPTRNPNAPGYCPPALGAPDLGPPDTRRIPDLNGSHDLGPSIFWANRLQLTYDTRDVHDIPTEGGYSNLYVEAADRKLGSSESFVKWGGEWRAFIPLRDKSEFYLPILALRAQLDYTSGNQGVPFWEQNDLGGRRRLRGFGSARFIDFNRSLITTELRTRVYQRHIFGVNAEIELAPFLEAGQVFHRINESPFNDLHWVGGLGIRGVVRPQIVGFVDIGRGSEGMAVFTGINYPF